MEPAPRHRLVPLLTLLALAALGLGASPAAINPGPHLDRDLREALGRHGFTGTMEMSLERRLGRPVDPQLADLGRLLWFDTITGLNDDNSCGGCHSPTNGFGDTQSIAIGIENNGIVGPNRTGPRNQRRAPIVINNVFYPNLMWNSRFASLSNDPFDNTKGFIFPDPEGLTLSYLPQLLTAQAFIPPTERNEVAGFTFPGDNSDIRNEVLRRLNAVAEYRRLFAKSFADVRAGGPITFDHFGRATAEFEFSLAFTDAPLDRFARGEAEAMTPDQKRGALLFFGKAGCVGCHAVSGNSNEMFSDFQQHVIGVPQVVPAVTNSVFDGSGGNEDFGLEQITGDKKDRYKFRTSPLRNLAVQTTFCHNGAFTSIEEAVRHHLDVFESARNYQPTRLDADLQGALGPTEPVLRHVDPLLSDPIVLSGEEFIQVVEFLRGGLLDPRSRFENLRALIPSRVPSGRPVLVFEDPSVIADAGARSASPQPRSTSSMSVRSGVSALRLDRGLFPSSGALGIGFELAESRGVSARIHDVAGRLVRILESDRRFGPGRHVLGWDGRDNRGRDAARGIYFVVVRAGAEEARARILKMR